MNSKTTRDGGARRIKQSIHLSRFKKRAWYTVPMIEGSSKRVLVDPLAGLCDPHLEFMRPPPVNPTLYENARAMPYPVVTVKRNEDVVPPDTSDKIVQNIAIGLPVSSLSVVAESPEADGQPLFIASVPQPLLVHGDD